VIRVLLCDDVETMRVALRAVLDLRDGIEVVGEARNGHEAIELATGLQPDVVLLDLTMPGKDGLEALPDVRRAAPAARVVILSGHEGRPIEEAALRGAERFLLKTPTRTRSWPRSRRRPRRRG
jgi:YesN/AraC family two-component response regulator